MIYCFDYSNYTSIALFLLLWIFNYGTVVGMEHTYVIELQENNSHG